MTAENAVFIANQSMSIFQLVSRNSEQDCLNIPAGENDDAA
jgi:hypothetical protein